LTKPLKSSRWFLYLLVAWLISQASLFGADFFKIREGIIESAWRKVAFFYVTPNLTLTNLGYTSNIFSYKNMAEPDWTADIGLECKISTMLGNRFILSFTGHPSYAFYLENADQRTFNNQMQAAVYTYFGPFNLGYRFQEDHLFRQPYSEFGAPIKMDFTGHHVTLDLGRHDHFFINFFFTKNRSEFKDEDYLGSYNLKSLLDRREQKAGIGLNKIIFSRTRLTLAYEYFDYRFIYEPGRDGSGDQVFGELEFPEIGRIKGMLQLGIRRFNPDNPLYQGLTQPFGSGKIAVSLFQRLKLHLQYLVDHFYSFWRQDDNYNERSAGATLEYYLGKRVKVGGSAGWGKISYENLISRTETRRDDFSSIAVNIGFKVFANIGIGLEYRVYRADSSLPEFSRRFDFIGGYVIHEF